LQHRGPARALTRLRNDRVPATDYKLPGAMQYAQDFSVLGMRMIVE